MSIRNFYFETEEVLLTKATDSQNKFGLDGDGDPHYGQEVVNFFPLKNQSLTRSWMLDWRGCLVRNKVGCSFGFGIWAWPLEASHYARPKTPLTILLDVFSPFLWTLNKVWPFNPTASWLGRPKCESTLNIVLYTIVEKWDVCGG
jgi:hypothetical protein